MKKFSDFFEQPKEKPKNTKNKTQKLNHKSTRRYDPNPTPTPKKHQYYCVFYVPPAHLRNDDEYRPKTFSSTDVYCTCDPPWSRNCI